MMAFILVILLISLLRHMRCDRKRIGIPLRAEKHQEHETYSFRKTRNQSVVALNEQMFRVLRPHVLFWSAQPLPYL